MLFFLSGKDGNSSRLKCVNFLFIVLHECRRINTLYVKKEIHDTSAIEQVYSEVCL